MAKKIQKEEKIEAAVKLVKADNTKSASKDSSNSQTNKAEKVTMTSKKNAEVKTDTPKKAETLKKVPVVKGKSIQPAKVEEVVPNPKVKIADKKNVTSVAATEIKSEVNVPKVVSEEKLKKETKVSKAPEEVKIIESINKKESDNINEQLETPVVKSDLSSNVVENAVIDPSIRYSDEDLEEFAIIIKESKDEALEELRMLKERLEDLTSSDVAEESMIYSMHMAEQGSEAQEKEKTYAQIQRIQEYLKKLEDAMDRIKNKTYGICRVCGCLIAKARLLAVPITTLSASYKIHQRCPEDGNDKIEAIKK
jgi:RNA polymerase-binding transcription factor DksA